MPANTQRGSQRAPSRGPSTQTRKNQKSNGSGAQSGRAQSSQNRAQSSQNGSRAQSGHGTLTDIGISAISATIGVAGGVLLGRTALQRNRKVLGVSVPSKIDFGDIGQQIGEAGRQFGKLATEVNAVRQKAEKIGRILT
jgi:hypothetical protein